MEVQGLWKTERIAGLKEALATRPEDFAEIADALHSVLEAFWMSQAIPNFDQVLEGFRAGTLIVGCRQNWMDSGTHEAPEEEGSEPAVLA
jgi:hypothetical protein